MIREQPDIAYQLLISAVETIANEALGAFQPSDDEKVEHHRAVYDLVKRLGITDDVSHQVAIAACKRERWATRKFKRFLTDNLDEAIWDTEDLRLFQSTANRLWPFDSYILPSTVPALRPPRVESSLTRERAAFIDRERDGRHSRVWVTIIAGIVSSMGFMGLAVTGVR